MIRTPSPKTEEATARTAMAVAGSLACVLFYLGIVGLLMYPVAQAAGYVA
ncbi:MAG: hypothetical protein HY704_16810 [Gemmatimonadetes bacterium]|nr:hypothetical protein [Gemmatimonadota bacterium]